MAMKPEEEKVKDDNEKETLNLETEAELKCSPNRILQAISVLRQLNEKYYVTCEKKPLLDDISGNPVLLQISLKKIPALKWRQSIKVPLPNPIVNDKIEVCLITGDLDKRNRKAEIEPDILHYKELLKSQNIAKISEVLTLRQLRTEYKSFEARRNLCGAYDIFLCDKKIAGVMPKVLGKCFFGKGKIPIQINMQRKNLKGTIDKVLQNTMFHLKCRGNCCLLKVGSLSMKEDEILNNITSSIDFLKEKLPGGVNNIMGLYVKTSKSRALPLYVSFDNPNEVKVKKRKFKKEKVVEEEITTLPGAKVKVFRSGRVIVRKTKSRRGLLHKSKKLKGNSSLVKQKTKGNKAVKKNDKVNENTEIDNIEDSEPTPHKKFKKEKNADCDVDAKPVHEEEKNDDNKPAHVAVKKNAKDLTSRKNELTFKSTKIKKELTAVEVKGKKVKRNLKSQEN